MADNQLVYTHFETGVDVYALFTAPDGQVWATDSSAMETYATADIADYDVAAVEEGTASRRYKLTIPALPADMYRADFYKRAGASPAEGDLYLGSIGPIVWSGTALVHIAAAARTNLNTVFNTDFANAYNTTGDCFRAQLDNGVEHGGSTATVVLKSAVVANSTGDAVSLSSSGSNGSGLSLAGNGAGHGIVASGGLTGDGVHLLGIGAPALKLEASSGDAVQISSGGGNGDGIQITANGTGKDINLAGSGTIAGTVAGIAGTLTTLDALDTAQDSQHATTQGKVDTVDGIVDAILVDTNELQTDWADGGRLDLIVDAILDDTDLIDDATSGLAKIATDVAAILVDTGTTLQAELDGIQADTENIQTRLPAALVGGRIDATVDGTGMEAGAVAAIWTTALTESYAAAGAGFTGAQALYEICQSMTEVSVSGTTLTAKKRDAATTAATFTLDDADAPTSRTRAT